MEITMGIYKNTSVFPYQLALDTFPIGSSLTAGDTDVAVTLSAGTDKWWLSYLVVSIDVKVMRLLAVCRA